MPRPPLMKLMGLAMLLLWPLVACNDGRPLPTEVTVQPHTQVEKNQAPTSPGDSAAADSVAYWMAIVLQNAALRHQLLEDLRDSPWRKHALLLESYLRGPRGKLLVAVASSNHGLSADRLLAIVARFNLQVVMPRAIDREGYAGSDSLLVFASAEAMNRRAVAARSVRGYTVRGKVVNIPLWAYTPYPYIALVPTDIAFGPDSEAVRSSAPRQPRATISTRAEEVAAMTVRNARQGNSDPIPSSMLPQSLCECDRCPDADYCQFPPPPPPPPAGLLIPSGRSFEQCDLGPVEVQADSDSDSDGFLDICEAELAHAFRPRLAISMTEEDATREPYYSVTIKDRATKTAAIFYAIGYHEDMGSPLPACPGCGSHLGDSEFIIVEVTSVGGGRWYLSFGTLSAHWGTFADNTARYAYDALEYPTVYRGRPRIWVAEDKHANYRSQSVCDAGAYYTDNCDRNSDNSSFGNSLDTPVDSIGASENLGESGVAIFADSASSGRGIIDCVESVIAPWYPSTECFWTATKFYGWYAPSGDGSTPYQTSLAFFGF